MTLLQIKDLKVSFHTYSGSFSVLREINLSVNYKETVAIVGESGSGKSILGHSILRLISSPGIIEGGSIYLEGENLLQKSEKEMRRIRGREIGMIFQDPATALNPTMSVGKQITEGLSLSREAKKEKAIEMLSLVGIPDASIRVSHYPYQFSGGMRQRIMIAIALAAQPKLLIADEPTTGLDVTVQAQILELLKEIQRKMEMSILFITHDLGVVANICDRVIVMYAGSIVEEADVYTLFSKPYHPYTKALLRSCPRLDKDHREKLIPIKGSPPSLSFRSKGCSFCPRCDDVMQICQLEPPKIKELTQGHRARCWK
jgi:oligopeptide transport system ATP-binding protein